jgi:hypothetical protein
MICPPAISHQLLLLAAGATGLQQADIGVLHDLPRLSRQYLTALRQADQADRPRGALRGASRLSASAGEASSRARV